jgi:hypothetical protein
MLTPVCQFGGPSNIVPKLMHTNMPTTLRKKPFSICNNIFINFLTLDVAQRARDLYHSIHSVQLVEIPSYLYQLTQLK